MAVRLALMTEPQQGLSYAEILALARTAEEAGLEAFFRSDHFASFPGPAGEPTTDAWSTLAGLARDTRRIHIGSLVSPVTFRIPGVFADTLSQDLRTRPLAARWFEPWRPEGLLLLGSVHDSVYRRFRICGPGSAPDHHFSSGPYGTEVLAGRAWGLGPLTPHILVWRIPEQIAVASVQQHLRSGPRHKVRTGPRWWRIAQDSPGVGGRIVRGLGRAWGLAHVISCMAEEHYFGASPSRWGIKSPYGCLRQRTPAV